MRKTILLTLIMVCLTAGIVGAAIEKGPYLLYPGNNDEMMVLWQVSGSETGTLEWGETTSYSSGSVQTSEIGSDHQHEHVITGLTPGVKYYYRVTEGGGSHTGSFLAAPADLDVGNVKFIAFGDTRTNPDDFDRVSDDMVNAYTADPDYQTITLLAGDWSERGEESHWTGQFFNRGYANNLEFQANMPIAGCIGNHEDDGSVYRKYYPYPYVSNHYWSFDYGPVHIAVVDVYAAYNPGSTQGDWLANDLASTTKEWKIIMLHPPGWTTGDHSNDTAVQNNIQPLCLTYGVDLVIAGHNHTYVRCLVDGVHHITTGGGGAPLDPDGNPNDPFVIITESTLNYCTIDVQGYDLTFTAIRSPEDTQIESFTLQHAVPTTPLNEIRKHPVDPRAAINPGEGAQENGAVDGCEFSKDGLLYTASDNYGEARIYVTQTGELIGKVTHQYDDSMACANSANEINGLAFSADGLYLATGDGGNDGVKVWDATQFTEGSYTTDTSPLYYKESGAEVDGLDFSPNNKWLAIASDEEVVVYDQQNNFSQLVRLVGPGASGAVNSVDFSSDSKYVVWALSGGKSYVYSTPDLDGSWTYRDDFATNNPQSVKSCRFSPDDQYICVSGRNQEMEVWKTNGGDRNDFVQEHVFTHNENQTPFACDDQDSNAAIEAVEWTPDGQYLISGGLISGRLSLYNVGTWTKVTFSTGLDYILGQQTNRQIEFIDTIGNLVLVGGDEGGIRIFGLDGAGFDPIDPPTPATFPVPTDGATDVSLLADISWYAGTGAATHDVYFGTDSTPDAGEFMGNQASTTYDPGVLSEFTTYYWAVDEINYMGTATGPVWSFTTGATEFDPPTPDPATFAVAPAADSASAISMTATTGSDPAGPVEYYFTCTAGGGNSSSWQTSTSYTDTGLAASTEYTYTVTMRDGLGNAGAASSPANATTYSCTASGRVQFIYTQTDDSTGSGTLSGCIDFTSIGGPASLYVTGVMPAPTINQKGSAMSVPAGMVGYINSQGEANPGDSSTGVHLGWTGDATLSGSYGGSTYSVTVPLVLPPTAVSGYEYEFKLTDDYPSNDVSGGAVNFCGWVGDDGDGHRHTALAVGLTTGADTLTINTVIAALGDYAFGDTLGITAGCRVGATFNDAMYVDEVTFIGSLDIGGLSSTSDENDPPTPDPATFAVAPAAISESAISMTSTTGTDVSGPVQYYFDATDGGNDSGWQTSTSYTDTGLAASTQYTYTVQMRDSASTPNVGTASGPASAITDDPPPPDTDPPTPDPAEFASPPSADSSSAISMTATTGSDVTGPVNYLFTETSGNPGGSGSGWQSSTSYTDSGLNASTQYTYTVQMRDGLGNTGAASSGASATTDDLPLVLPWTEDFESGSFTAGGWTTTGTASVATQAAYSGVYGAKIPGQSSSIETAIDTSGFSSIHVKYRRETTSLDAGEYILVEWYDGSSWNPLETIEDCDFADGLQDKICGAGADNNANFKIRFSTSSNKTNETSYVDDIQVTGTSATPDTDPPTPNPASFASAPAAISDTAISMTAVTGTDASGPVQYLFTCTAGGGNDSAWQTSTSYTDTGLAASTQYTYTVQMRDSASTPNVGAASSGASATTEDPLPPDTDPPTPDPAAFASPPSADSSSAISMTAATGTDASGPVEYYFDATDGGNDSAWQTGTSYTDTGLAAETLYTYTVTMRDSLGNTGAASPGASATTDAEAVLPAAPSNLSATAISKTQIDLSWTDNASDETGFKIERKARVNGVYAEIATVGQDVTSHSDTTVKKGTLYFYRVRATNASGDSAYSNEASATTPK